MKSASVRMTTTSQPTRATVSQRPRKRVSGVVETGLSPGADEAADWLIARLLFRHGKGYLLSFQDTMCLSRKRYAERYGWEPYGSRDLRQHAFWVNG